ncbi:ArsR family transcriptional regulator [Scopulibacillus darangshiensis]|uniref:ArsR family transcriptional regulator n=1 Tax=Scopulibacillus darangshiensis TaxID=442528 RepID=A0A4R2P2U7_9BACL|nr:metalloregulator ArsR/SmtB family transcription factor [Scopulibacillus darangshiensis]TCP28897.1 ArsR family transcriptional regulator [Scopulibacillus darangshiensis]
MNQINIETKTKFLRGFADKTRIQILDCLKNGEKPVSQIVKEINGNQSNISQHLACLKGCGIIRGRQEGKYVYYSLRNAQVKQLLQMFDDVLFTVESDVRDCDMNDVCLSSKERSLVHD